MQSSRTDAVITDRVIPDAVIADVTIAGSGIADAATPPPHEFEAELHVTT
jgi:hypothetical protein